MKTIITFLCNLGNDLADAAQRAAEAMPGGWWGLIGLTIVMLAASTALSYRYNRKTTEVSGKEAWTKAMTDPIAWIAKPIRKLLKKSNSWLVLIVLTLLIASAGCSDGNTVTPNDDVHKASSEEQTSAPSKTSAAASFRKQKKAAAARTSEAKESEGAKTILAQNYTEAEAEQSAAETEIAMLSSVESAEDTAENVESVTTVAPTAHEHTWEEIGHNENVMIRDAYDEPIVAKAAWDEQILVKDAWDEQLLVSDAWDEQVMVEEEWDEPIYECHSFCNQCGIDLTVNCPGEYVNHLMDVHDGAAGWYSRNTEVDSIHHDAQYETVHHDAEYQTVHHEAEYQTVHHDAEYGTVHHDAQYEQRWIVDGYRCSGCGEVK